VKNNRIRDQKEKTTRSDTHGKTPWMQKRRRGREEGAEEEKKHTQWIYKKVLTKKNSRSGAKFSFGFFFFKLSSKHFFVTWTHSHARKTTHQLDIVKGSKCYRNEQKKLHNANHSHKKNTHTRTQIHKWYQPPGWFFLFFPLGAPGWSFPFFFHIFSPPDAAADDNFSFSLLFFSLLGLILMTQPHINHTV